MSALLKPDPLAQEQRRHARVRVAIDGRFMLENKQEYPCQTIDMSPGGVRLRTTATGRTTEKVVAYLDHFGRIEGLIVRQLSDGFAMKLSVTPTKRERVADLLTWLVNRTAIGMEEDRRHSRLVPRVPDTMLHVSSGPTLPARIIDISLSGVGILVEEQPSIGARVVVGHTPGKVVRHLSNGIAVEFLRLVPSETFDDDIVL